MSATSNPKLILGFISLRPKSCFVYVGNWMSSGKMSDTFHGLSRIDKDAAKLLPELITHASDIKRMDDAHAEEYLWSDATSTWISPWQASELNIIMLAASLAEITKRDRVIDLGCGESTLRQ
jgi:hypothetical protein